MAPSYEEVSQRFAPPFDFEVYTANLRNIDYGCLAAPHAGAIEAMTGEIMLATARISSWSYYVFEGRLRRNNFKQLHISSTSFREPKFLAKPFSRNVRVCGGGTSDGPNDVFPPFVGDISDLFYEFRLPETEPGTAAAISL